MIKLRKIFTLISIVLCLSIVFPLCVFAEGVQQSGYYNKEKIEQYKDNMMITINGSSPESTWNEETVVSNEFPLYDLDYKINGYVYEFKNGDKETGFLQIDCTSEDYIVDAYSFGGKHTASILNENLQDNSLKNEKNIYLGGYTYLKEKKSLFRSSSNAQYISMTDNKVLDTTKASLKNYYSSYKDVQARSFSSAVQRSTVNSRKMVYNYIEQSWMTQGKVGGGSYSNACAPIAGTNICKYYATSRSRWNLLKNNSDYNTFYRIHTLMGTNSADMTNYENVYSGLTKYMIETAGTPQRGGQISGICDFNQIRNIINQDIPVCFGYGVSGGHYVVCFGYVIDLSNAEYISIADGFSINLVTKRFSPQNSNNEFYVNKYWTKRSFYLGYN